MAIAATVDSGRNRALGAGEILSRSVALIIAHPGLFALIALPNWIGPLVRGWADEPPVDWGLWFGAFAVDFLLVRPLSDAALIYAVARCYAGRKVSARDAYGRAIRVYPLVVAAYFLTDLSILLGLCLLVVPGIMLALWFSFVGVIVVLEGLGAVQALKRGYELTKESFATAGAYWALMLGIGLLMGVETVLIPSGGPRIMLGAALMVVCSILNVVLATIFYFSCRAKIALLNTPAPQETTSGAAAAG